MPLSGTVILCDHVYQTQGGKYVIAGTYTTLEVHLPDLQRIQYQVPALNAYVRVRPEAVGSLALRVRFRDEQRPPWDPPLVTLGIEIQVAERNIRLVECPLSIPPFALQIEGGSSALIELRYAIELLHDSELIASTPLDLRFIKRS